mmetsp:Transcript_32037/g.55238  ORF Transcript_32037/g.55238 Transcript_32037/m.55238 type:complete len:191 (+) Transcript_32037:562-1134(+)
MRHSLDVQAFHKPLLNVPAVHQTPLLSSSLMVGSVFVTVGTTEFDALIRAVDTDAVRNALKERGVTDIMCQIGRGRFKPRLPYFDYTSDISPYIRDADLVISHAGNIEAGAGTIIETLRSHKPLIVVINSALMDNHQIEIAAELSRKGCLTIVEDPSTLPDAILGPWARRPLSPPQTARVAAVIRRELLG